MTGAAVSMVIAVLLAAAAASVLVDRAPDRRMRAVIDPGSTPRVTWRPLPDRVGRRRWPGPRQRRRDAADRMRTVHALSALAAELEAGQPPAVALERCAEEPPVWPRALAALRVDADVVDALREDARRRPLLTQLAACWSVASESGSGLAQSVSSLAVSARTAEDTRVALEAELAGPRSTARLLSMLPVVGIGFGTMLGADPLGWLLGSSLGRACLLVAVGLIGAGTLWTGRIASAVDRLM